MRIAFNLVLLEITNTYLRQKYYDRKLVKIQNQARHKPIEVPK